MFQSEDAIEKVCVRSKPADCGYDAVKAKAGGKVLARLEATVESTLDTDDRELAAQDVADVTYDKFSEQELDEVSLCVDCLRTICPLYMIVQQEYPEHPYEIVLRDN